MGKVIPLAYVVAVGAVVGAAAGGAAAWGLWLLLWGPFGGPR